jgi:hypothetical protein
MILVDWLGLAPNPKKQNQRQKMALRYARVFSKAKAHDSKIFINFYVKKRFFRG